VVPRVLQAKGFSAAATASHGELEALVGALRGHPLQPQALRRRLCAVPSGPDSLTRRPLRPVPGEEAEAQERQGEGEEESEEASGSGYRLVVG